jgi:hypothetical protein
LHVRPARQVSFAQQRCMTSPQATHEFMWQTVFGAVQPTPPPQHAWPIAPQAPPMQLPFMHVP